MTMPPKKNTPNDEHGLTESKNRPRSRGDTTTHQEQSASTNFYDVAQRSIELIREEVKGISAVLSAPDTWAMSPQQLEKVVGRRDACLRLLDLLNRSLLEENSREIDILTKDGSDLSKKKRSLRNKERFEMADLMMRTLERDKFVSCWELAKYLKQHSSHTDGSARESSERSSPTSPSIAHVRRAKAIKEIRCRYRPRKRPVTC